MLQVEPVPLSNFAVDCALDPGDRVHNFIVPPFEQFDSDGEFGIDGPDE